MQRTFTEADLVEFMDYLAKKGLVKDATVRSRKVAALKVLSALDDHEKLDLRNVDRDSAFHRFVNKLGKGFSPDSLTTYRSRFNSAMDDFLRYQTDPSAFKTSSQQRTARKGKELTPTVSGKKVAKAARQTSEDRLPPPPPPPPPLGSIVFPIPLRDGVVVQIHNLPNDLTSAEAQRISAIVNALAIPGMEKTKA